MFNIGRDVFVMGMRALERLDFRVGHRVVPPQRFVVIGELVKIFENPMRDKVYLLEYVQYVAGVKGDLAP